MNKGYFLSSPSNEMSFDETNEKSHKKTMWLVYKWEGLKPLSEYSYSEQKSITCWPWEDVKNISNEMKKKMLK